MNLELTNKTALISGSTKGIGFAIASQLASEGARVIVNGRSDKAVHSALEQIRKQAPAAGSPFPPLDPKYPDLPVGKWYEYGFKEGVPRLLDMWDRVGVKVTSHMVGQAVERHPELAKEIVDRGHEAAGPGQH